MLTTVFVAGCSNPQTLTVDRSSQTVTVVAGNSVTLTARFDGNVDCSAFNWKLPNGSTVSYPSTNMACTIDDSTDPLSGERSSWMNVSYTINPVTADMDGKTYTVTAYLYDNRSVSSTATRTLQVQIPPAFTKSPASQTVTVGQSATFTSVATGTAPLTYQWYKNGTAISGATSTSYTTPATTATGNVSYGVVATNVAGTVVSDIATLTVNGLDPKLAFTAIASHTFGDSPITLSTTSSSTGAVSYKVVSGPATVSGSALTITGAGTVQLQASQAAAGSYASATATTSFVVNTATPKLAFATVPTHTYGDAAFAVSASSASTGAVTYSVASGPATISGNSVTLTGAGTVQLQASQAATGNYAAGSATTSFTVNAATPSLSFGAIAAHTYGDAAFPVTASSASSGAVTYSVVSGPATISGNTVTLTGAGTVQLKAAQAAATNYNAATATTSFTVSPAAPVLAFKSIASHTYGDAAFAVSASSASTGAITYSVVSGPATMSGSTVTITGVGTVQLQASQAAGTNYAAATATTSFVVNPATPALAFTTIAAHTYGDSSFSVAANSASSGAVSYSILSGPATISGSTITLTGAGTVRVQASQVASGNYAASTTITSFVVNPATPTLAFDAISTQTYSAQTITVHASSASSGDVSYSVLSGPATVAGNQVTLTGAGVVQLQAMQAATSSYNSASATTSFTVVAPTVVIAPITPADQTTAPGTISFATTVSGGVLNAVSWKASGGTIDSNGNWSSPTTAGVYTITATSVDNPATFKTTTATISAPVILAQPANKTACAGTSATIAFGAEYGTSFAWSKVNGSTLYQSSPDLIFNSLALSDSGSYTAMAINNAGTVTSNPMLLNVVTPVTLAISSQPASVTVYATQTATFSVSAAGSGTLKYQWYKNGVAIADATSSVYTTGALDAANSGEVYTVTVNDPDCSNQTITSADAVLTVSTMDTAVPPTIVVQPLSVNAALYGEAGLAVTASGSGTLAYQWYRVPYTATGMANVAGAAITGATGAAYTVPTTSTDVTNDGDQYFVVVSNEYGTAVSQRATLGVDAGVVITTQPVGMYIPSGSMATYSVKAKCTGCTPAYAWYIYAPGSSTPQLLSDSTVSSGNALDAVLDGATISGSQSDSLVVSNVPASANNAVVYAVVTATDGSTQISGLHPVVSKSAALAVGNLGTIGNTTSSMGLCNDASASVNWVTNGYRNSVANLSVGVQDITNCKITLTNGQSNEQAAVYWPKPVLTANMSIAFTVTMTNTGNPGDGFALVLADPTQGATTTTLGRPGEGLGAAEIPGLVVGFDTYQNGNNQNNTVNCSTANNSDNGACDPMPVSYMAVGQGASALWENPWTNVNGYLNTQNSSSYSPSVFASSTHDYVVSVRSGVTTITMDGYELFTGKVDLPPVAYLGFTASTGGATETVVLSKLTAVVSAP